MTSPRPGTAGWSWSGGNLIPETVAPVPAFTSLYGKGQEQLAIDGVKPRLFVAPATAEEAAQAITQAHEQRLATGLRGGGTRLGLGNPPRTLDLVVSTEKLNRVVDYEPADLTITVGAGLPFAELQRMLGERGQFLPLDPPAAPGSTIGGVIATNASGPLRLRYGSARDLVIGTQVANPTGGLARAGGRVVKNVTGYDLNKLYVGSLGTLGLITELTFKVAPKPETSTTFLARFADVDAACRTAYRVLRSPLTPSTLEVVRSKFEGRDEVSLEVLIAGFVKPVKRSLEDLTRFAQEEGGVGVGTINEAEDVEAAARADFLSHDGAWLKMAVPIGEVAWAFRAVEAAAAVANLDASVTASAGVGVLRIGVSPRSGEAGSALVGLIRRLRAEAAEHLGSLIVEDCPVMLKQQLDVFGDVPDNFEIMRRLKSQLDPGGILNPGRFLGRL